VPDQTIVVDLIAQLRRLAALRDQLTTFERLLLSEAMHTAADELAPKASRRQVLITSKGPRGRPLYWAH